jgi:hypothetical protein
MKKMMKASIEESCLRECSEASLHLDNMGFWWECQKMKGVKQKSKKKINKKI